MDLGDAACVKQVLSGDKAAFGSLVERHRPMVLRLAGRLFADPFGAEDIV